MTQRPTTLRPLASPSIARLPPSIERVVYDPPSIRRKRLSLMHCCAMLPGTTLATHMAQTSQSGCQGGLATMSFGESVGAPQAADIGIVVCCSKGTRPPGGGGGGREIVGNRGKWNIAGHRGELRETDLCPNSSFVSQTQFCGKLCRCNRTPGKVRERAGKRAKGCAGKKRFDHAQLENSSKHTPSTSDEGQTCANLAETARTLRTYVANLL